MIFIEKKNLGINYSDFKQLIDDNCYYVDKTNIIEDLLKDKAKVTIFTRPSKFGKSLLLSTLYYFFDIENKDNNKYLFNNLNISKSKYMKYFGQYPVIYIDFKKMNQNTYEDMLDAYKQMVIDLYKSKSYLLDSINEYDKYWFNKTIQGDIRDINYQTAILDLCKYLYKYYNKRVIILIQNYDVCNLEGYLNGFYDKIVSFIMDLFSISLKGNEYLEMSILVGVLHVGKESVFSDFNNYISYTIVDNEYNKYFGFTEEETVKLLNYYDLELLEEVKDMYGGYNIGNTYLYNPYSIINYVKRMELREYYNNELINTLISNSSDFIKTEFKKLLEGNNVMFYYESKITYLDINKINSLNVIINLLLMHGYLTIGPILKDIFKDNIDTVVILNDEVKQIFINCINNELNKNSVCK